MGSSGCVRQAEEMKQSGCDRVAHADGMLSILVVMQCSVGSTSCSALYRSTPNSQQLACTADWQQTLQQAILVLPCMHNVCYARICFCAPHMYVCVCMRVGV